jgi:hypothetical protein
VPFRLTWVPAGSTVESCSVAFRAGLASGGATIRMAKSGYLTVGTEWPATAPDANTKIGGRPALIREYPGDGKALIFQIDIDFVDHVVDLLAEGRYEKATVLRIANGYQEVGGTDPAGWPAGPLS